MHMGLVCNKKPMKILLIFRFFHYIWYIDKENLFHSYFERKNDKSVLFNTVHFQL